MISFSLLANSLSNFESFLDSQTWLYFYYSQPPNFKRPCLTYMSKRYVKRQLITTSADLCDTAQCFISFSLGIYMTIWINEINWYTDISCTVTDCCILSTSYQLSDSYLVSWLFCRSDCCGNFSLLLQSIIPFYCVKLSLTSYWSFEVNVRI